MPLAFMQEDFLVSLGVDEREDIQSNLLRLK